MGLRIVQWTTGNVGREALRSILERPDFELAGVYTHSETKVGRDAGDLCGMPQTGIQATSDAGALLAASPDCVMYAPVVPDLDEICRILEAGVNIVTTCSFFRGRYFGVPDAEARIEAAAQRGGVSIFGGGYNPGIITMLPLVLASVSRNVESVHMYEESDVGLYESAPFFQMLGWGKPPKARDRVERPAIAKALDGSLYDALDMLVDAFGLEVTERTAQIEYATTRKEIALPFMTFPAGSVAGQRSRWEYKSGERVVISMNITWWIGEQLEPNFANPEIDGHGVHRFEIEGDPCVDMQMGIRPRADKSLTSHMADAMTGTAMNALNAAHIVCAAPPGIRSYLDLPPAAGIAFR